MCEIRENKLPQKFVPVKISGFNGRKWRFYQKCREVPKISSCPHCVGWRKLGLIFLSIQGRKQGFGNFQG